MTVWQDRPPQTRREARERERREALDSSGGSRRATATEPTQAGEAPQLSTPFIQVRPTREGDESEVERERETVPASSFAPPTRPRLPRYDGPFDLTSHDGQDDLEKTLPGVTNHRARPQNPDFYRTGRDDSEPEPVTVPVALVPGRQPGRLYPPETADESDTHPPQDDDAVPERTLTRRELRAMLQAQQANEQARGDEEHPEQGEAHPLGDDKPLGDDNPLSDDHDGAPRASAEAAESDHGPSAVAVAPPATVALQGGSTQRDEADAASAPVAARPAPRQSSFDDVLAQNTDNGGSTTASNALILPVVPSAPDATGPLTSTGEILVTGTIDLPRSLGATGQHPDRYDSSEMDRLFDQEADPRTSDVAPVRASRAVSTHTSTRGMIAPPKKRSSRLPVILPVTAAVLALAVIGLVIAGVVFKVF
ncbi:hypothetical protein OSC27_08135 [Microbacterium sp. STN6]|uniref:hypothetical protein n=1 Tax=Microbacterium sp. STN6 TaxID=2995588 RepID=UPI002260B709|nr:hypothetical protein [Microbacterium sp. STN6]MCX7522245.1 hypothetical protein [Microbacterium sp. STN6]